MRGLAVRVTANAPMAPLDHPFRPSGQPTIRPPGVVPVARGWPPPNPGGRRCHLQVRTSANHVHPARHCKARHAVPIETRFFAEGALNALTFGLLTWAAFGVVACALLG